MKKILFIIGSLRKESFNKKLAKEVEQMLAGRATVEYLDYSDVPLMNQDIEFPAPEPVKRVRGKVAEADCQWSTATAAVKLFAVDGMTCVMGSDNASGCRMLSVSLALCQYLIIYTLGEWFHSLFLCFCCKPIFINLCVFSFIHVHTLFVRR